MEARCSDDTTTVPQTQTAEPLIASASVDGEIKFWRLRTGTRHHKSVKDHKGAVWAVTDLGDGRVASGGKDSTLRMWDLCRNGDLCQEIAANGGADPVTSLQPLWDGQLAVGHGSGMIQVFSIGDGGAQDARFGKMAQVVAEATGQCVSDGGLVATLSGHRSSVNALSAVECGSRRLLVSGSDDKNVCVFDATSRALLSTIEAGSFVYAIADLGDGFICVGLQSGALQVWNVSTCELAASVPKAHDGLWVKALCSRPGVAGVVSGGGDCCVRLWKWDAAAKAIEPSGEPFTGHSKAVTSVFAHADGWILSGGGLGVRVWGRTGIADGTVVREHDAMVTCITTVVQRELVDGESSPTRHTPAPVVSPTRIAVSTEAAAPVEATAAADAEAPGSVLKMSNVLNMPGSVFRNRKDGARIPPFAFC